MAIHKSRSNKKNKCRSRKKHGGFFGPFVGFGDKIRNFFGSKSKQPNTITAPIAPGNNNNISPSVPPQSGGSRKKTKKRHHYRNRK